MPTKFGEPTRIFLCSTLQIYTLFLKCQNIFCFFIWLYFLCLFVQPILKPYNEFPYMKASTIGFLVENLVTGLEIPSIAFFLRPVNPSLEFGGYKRTVDAQVPVAFRFPFTYLCLHLSTHPASFQKSQSEFLHTRAGERDNYLCLYLCLMRVHYTVRA